MKLCPACDNELDYDICNDMVRCPLHGEMTGFAVSIANGVRRRTQSAWQAAIEIRAEQAKAEIYRLAHA